MYMKCGDDRCDKQPLAAISFLLVDEIIFPPNAARSFRYHIALRHFVKGVRVNGHSPLAKPFGNHADAPFADGDIEDHRGAHDDAFHQLNPITADGGRDDPGFQRADDVGAEDRAENRTEAALADNRCSYRPRNLGDQLFARLCVSSQRVADLCEFST